MKGGYRLYPSLTVDGYMTVSDVASTYGLSYSGSYKILQDIFRSHFKDNGKEFLQLVKYANDNGVSYEDVYAAAEMLKKRGVKHFTADHFKVALQTLASEEVTFRENQKTDEFIEIEIGSEDILQQLENVMEKGTKMPR